jgi:hypothetical protein
VPTQKADANSGEYCDAAAGLSTRQFRKALAGPAGFPEREIFHDEVAFAARERATTSAARYLAFSGFWTDLGLDDVVGRFAIRALEKRLIFSRMTRRVAR